MAQALSASDLPPRRRRFRRWTWSRLLFSALGLLVAVRAGYLVCFAPPEYNEPRTIHEGRYELVRVVDGDTLLVRPLPQHSGSTAARPTLRVRLIGIDTPETVRPNDPVEPWGREAAAFTQEFLQGGELTLQLDRRRQDRFGRFLAYVLVDGVMLNEELVRAGYARAVHYPGDSPQIAKRLHAAQEEAQFARRGVWSDQPARASAR